MAFSDAPAARRGATSGTPRRRHHEQRRRGPRVRGGARGRARAGRGPRAEPVDPRGGAAKKTRPLPRGGELVVAARRVVERHHDGPELARVAVLRDLEPLGHVLRRRRSAGVDGLRGRLEDQDVVGLLRGLGAAVDRRQGELLGRVLLPRVDDEHDVDAARRRKVPEPRHRAVLRLEAVAAPRGLRHELQIVEDDVLDVVDVPMRPNSERRGAAAAGSWIFRDGSRRRRGRGSWTFRGGGVERRRGCRVDNSVGTRRRRGYRVDILWERGAAAAATRTFRGRDETLEETKNRLR